MQILLINALYALKYAERRVDAPIIQESIAAIERHLEPAPQIDGDEQRAIRGVLRTLYISKFLTADQYVAAVDALKVAP